MEGVKRDSVFDDLSGRIAPNERRKILSSISSAAEGRRGRTTDEEPVRRSALQRLEELLTRQGWWFRLWVKLIAMASGVPATSVFRGILLRRVGQRVQRSFGSLVDIKRRTFSPAFLTMIGRLYEQGKAVERVLGPLLRDRRSLVVAVVGQTIPTEHSSIIDLTDERHTNQWRDQQFAKVERALIDQIERRITALPQSAHLRIGDTLSTMEALSRLARIPFYHFFIAGGEGVGGSLPVERVVEELGDLYRTVRALPLRVDPVTVDAIAATSQMFGDEGDEIDGISNDSLRAILREQIERALTSYLLFMRRYDLLSLVRFGLQDPIWDDPPVECDRRWLTIYRGYLKERVHRSTVTSQTRVRLMALAEELLTMCETSVVPFPGVPNGEGSPVSRYYYRMLMINTFLVGCFPKTTPVLQLLLSTGEFHKLANRQEFERSYDQYLTLPTWREQIVRSLEEEGNLGQLIERATRGQTVFEEVQQRIDTVFIPFIESFHTACAQLSAVLEGVVTAESGAEYDTLININRIGGSKNAYVRGEFRSCQYLFTSLVELFERLSAQEERAAELAITIDPKTVPVINGASEFGSLEHPETIGLRGETGVEGELPFRNGEESDARE